jgi:hypothetical protein
VSRATQRTVLSGISECDANQVCLAPTTFAYSSAVTDFFDDIDTSIHDDTATGQSTPSVGAALGQIITGDINGDGCDDLIYTVYDKDGKFAHADDRLSSCYDAISREQPVFATPTPANLYQLSPSAGGAPDSQVPPFAFNAPISTGGYAPCKSSQVEVVACYNQIMGVDFDLDGRMDLLSYFISEDCGNPILSSCDISTTWDQNYTASIFLASSVPPAQWNPSQGLFGGETQTLLHTSIGKSAFSDTPPNSFYYTSAYIGDINGDGFPDLVRVTPNGWTYRLNHGRALTGNNELAIC